MGGGGEEREGRHRKQKGGTSVEWAFVSEKNSLSWTAEEAAGCFLRLSELAGFYPRIGSQLFIDKIE